MNIIDKDALVEEIERLKNTSLGQLQSFINNLKVIDPYEQCIQYASIESGIKAHAEDYSWNIESELFQQLTPEQQKLWRKEIEQAVISGGYSGLNLAKDPRYKENLEVKEAQEEPVSIWYDANQQPEINTPILVRTYDNIVVSTKRYDDNLIPWEYRIKRDEITHWCYVEDLLKL